jgi:hypothetical protein
MAATNGDSEWNFTVEDVDEEEEFDVDMKTEEYVKSMTGEHDFGNVDMIRGFIGREAKGQWKSPVLGADDQNGP